MKYFYSLCIAGALFVFNLPLHAQQNIGYTWSKVLNNSLPQGGNVNVQAVKTDATGNIFVVGSFSYTSDFDPGAGTAFLTSKGSNDIFFAKYTAAGSFAYVKQIGGFGIANPTGLEIDGSGNLYITGSFSGAADFDPGTGTASFTSANNDAFFAKYDANGNYIMAKRLGGSSSDLSYSIALDNSSNIYITGTFYNTVDFDPGAGTANLISAGQEDIFFAKYDANGNYVFAKRIGGTNFDGSNSITLDGTGNVYVTGYFRGTVDFDPGAGIVNLVNAGTGSDMFFAKYNSAGNYVYAKRIGGTSEEAGNCIVVDASGNAYLTGYFIGTVDFDPGAGTVNLVGGGARDIFIAKYDVSGNYIYARAMVGTGSEYGNSLTIDATGNLYVTGIFQNTVDFDPGVGTTNLTSAGNNDFFFAKYNASGNYVFAKGIGSTSGDGGFSITLNGSSQMIVAGAFNGTVDFDAGAGTANLISGISASGGFVTSYDNAGNYIFAAAFGGLDGTNNTEESRSVAIDGNGNVYTAGYIRGSVDFDPGPGTANFSSAGNQDIFFAKYDANGNYLFAKSIGGTANEMAYSIAIDGIGNIYVAGIFEGTVDFDPGPGTANLTSAGSGDVFVAKYDATGNYLFAKSMGGTSNDICFKMVLDASANIYITGNYQGTADLDPAAGTINLTSAGLMDIFLAKYDTDGNYVYAKSVGGSSSDKGSSISVDGSGNVYVTGYFYGTADFDPGAGTANLTSQGQADLFFAKYDAAGNYVFAKVIGSTGFDEATDIGVDVSGNIYITANFEETVDFDPGAGSAVLSGGYPSDIAFAKYDASGNYVYAKQISSGNMDVANALAVDGNGNIYITGYTQGTADFDPGAGAANLSGSNNSYITKYDADGNYVNAKGIVGTNLISNSIAIDGSNNIYITGLMFFTVDFDPGSGVAAFTANNNGDFFIAKYSSCTSVTISSLSITASPATVSATTSLTDGGCRLLATIEPNGVTPVSGTVNAQLWIEATVPTFAGQPFVARHYEVTPSTNPSTATGRVTLYFTQQEFDDFNNDPASVLNLPSAAGDAPGIANLKVGQYGGTSNNGTGMPGTYSGTAIVIDPADAAIVWNAALSRWEVSFDVTGFGGFIVQTTANILPVTLTQFIVKKKGAQAQLNWSTSTEQDNKGFAVERSTNGSSFNSIGFVAAKSNGNSTATQEYSFIDENPLPGSNSYRLQQQNVNGNFSYSMVRQTSFSKTMAVLLYPNPVGNILMIDLQQTQPLQLQIMLTDLQGRRLRNWNYKNAAGLLQLNVNGLIPGTYQLELLNEKAHKEVYRLLKQ